MLQNEVVFLQTQHTYDQNFAKDSKTVVEQLKEKT